MRYRMMTAIVCAGLAPPAIAQERAEVGADAPPVECHRTVNLGGSDAAFPGYLASEDGAEICVPFTPTLNLPPRGHPGDFYVDAYTDAMAREAWAACARDEVCLTGQSPAIDGQGGENTFRETGSLAPEGPIDPLGGDIDLALVRRPAFFGTAPYDEPIADAEDRTYTVEVEVPSEVNEHEFLGVAPDTTWRLRGWYIEGDGVPGPAGETQRVLIVMVAGRTIEMMATQHSDDVRFLRDGDTFAMVEYPTDRSEKWGMGFWRDYIRAMNVAGFDVLALDKRGHGISGGRQASNNAEMARDIFRALDALETGENLRLVTPGGDLLAGSQAGGILLAGQPAARMPVILAGSSQGSMVVSFAMHDVFVGDCAFDAAQATCGPTRDYDVRAGMLLAEFAKGPGYAPERLIREGAFRQKYRIAYLPTSEILDTIGQWPATFIGRGLWDNSGGLEGTLDLYRRAGTPKELVVVRGPHSEIQYGEGNIAHMQERMAAFARAVIAGANEIPGAAPVGDLKSLVLSAPPDWDPANDPDPS